MKPTTTPFLSAAWRNLALVNFEVEPQLLAPYVPRGTELDAWQGRTLLSLVGFQFLDTRVLGLAVPFHQSFDEVNLRFYVRRRMDNGWRRGVVFIRELAPHRAMAWTARALFGENYLTVPMRHWVELPNGDLRAVRHICYSWRHRGRDGQLALAISGGGELAAPGTREEFVIEHYWGYSGGPGRRTIEYQVDHPRWRLWPAHEARFDADVAGLYGPQFVEPLSAAPASAFLADGSDVTLYWGNRLEEQRESRV